MRQLPEPPHNPGEFLTTRTEVPYSGAPEPSADGEEAGLLDSWRLLRRRKGTLILIAATGMVVGFLVTVPQTPIYQAKTSLEIVGLNQNFLNVKSVSPVDEGSASPGMTDVQTQVKILQSESLVDRILAKLGSD